MVVYFRYELNIKNETAMQFVTACFLMLTLIASPSEI